MPADYSRSKNNHVVGLYAHHAFLTNNERSSWIVDSGAVSYVSRCEQVNQFHKIGCSRR